MISIIVCSVSPDKLKLFGDNLAHTIGTPYELIAIDNRKDNFSITKVYNMGAAQAKYPYVCFAHEDIAFHTGNWGEIILSQLALPQTGVIGFAGASIKTKNLSGWITDKKFINLNLIQRDKGIAKKELIREGNNPAAAKELFQQVITLDGLCMFSRKDVWAQNQFDERNFDGFHLYDLDFSFSVSRKFKNFVCFGIDIEHFSTGSYNHEWLRYTRVFHKKWEAELPASVNKLSNRELETIELHTQKSILYLILKRRLTPKGYVAELKDNFLRKNKNFINALYIRYMWHKYNKAVK